jgi:hypothetical protein
VDLTPDQFKFLHLLLFPNGRPYGVWVPLTAVLKALYGDFGRDDYDRQRHRFHSFRKRLQSTLNAAAVPLLIECEDKRIRLTDESPR